MNLFRRKQIRHYDLQKYPECKDMPFVLHIAKKIYRKWNNKLPVGLEISDLIQAGYLILHNCRINYNKDSGIKFSTYCGRALINGMNNYIKSYRNIIHIPLSTQNLIKKSKENKITKSANKILSMGRVKLEEKILVKEQEFDKEETEKAFKLLSERQLKVIELHYNSGMNFSEIGRSGLVNDKKICRELVRQIHDSAIKILKNYFNL